MAGGNVSISAQNDITHQTLIGGVPTADSSHELPVNWLYRRGYVDPATGQFGVVARSSGGTDVGSTTWWVDFSNFFEGVATLGGGNVSLSAGRNVSNVDAAAPTNARMPARNASGPLAPNAGALVELGGGDVTVQAGRQHRWRRVLRRARRGQTGRRSQHRHEPDALALARAGRFTARRRWTNIPGCRPRLFLGKGSFDVAARGDVLLGPVANVFLLPEGINNSFWYKTTFLDLRSGRQR